MKPMHPAGTRPPIAAVADAIVHTVAYVDVFDYPLTAEEVHRYLAGVAAPAGMVHKVLQNGRVVPGRVARRDEFFTLPGREGIVDTRRRRQAIAAELWPHALGYGRAIAALPFVKMVSVTGSLAVDNAEAGADIDYLVVTDHGRVWLARAFSILVVRLAARRGVHLCPNYFLSERHLLFEEQNLYTAHELVQMVPIAGLDTYRRLRQINPWTKRFLPNADQPPRTLEAFVPGRAQRGLRAFAETVLRTPAGGWLERWEMKRKIAKFSRDHRAGEVEAAFCAHWCKGHFDGHGHRILDAYQSRVQTLDR